MLISTLSQVEVSDPETSSEEELPPDGNNLYSPTAKLSVPEKSPPKPSFVKSCARFSIIQETKHQNIEPSCKTKLNFTPLINSSGKIEPETSPLNHLPSTSDPVVAQVNRADESLKDKLFRSLESLKRSNDASSVRGRSLKNLDPSKSKSKTLQANNGLKKLRPLTAEKNKVSVMKIDEANDDEKLNDYPVAVIGGDSPEVKLGYHGRPLAKPMFVVRPAPLIEDASESDDETKHKKRPDSTADIEDDSVSSDEESERSKNMRRRLRKFRRPKKDNLSLERDVIYPVLSYLSRRDIIRCMYVCKLWNRWAIDPRFWSNVDVSSMKITSNILIGIVRRQPSHLDLSWSTISCKQLSWLLARLPQLQQLKLAGCNGSCVSALSSSNIPLIKSLDLSFIDYLDDESIHEILSAPTDSRPGLLETKSRLRMLTSLSLAAADITDHSVRLISITLPHITHLDLSNCSRISDKAVSYIATPNRDEHVRSLLLYSCDSLTDSCLEPLKRCCNITSLDLRKCDRICSSTVSRFYHSQTFSHSLILTQEKLIRKKAPLT